MTKTAIILFALSWFMPAIAGDYMNHFEIVNKFNNLPPQDFSFNPANLRSTPKLEEVLTPSELEREKVPFNQALSPVPEARDYRYRDTPVKKQIGPRCSAYGLVAAMENLTGSPEKSALSESHLWSQYKKAYSKLAVKAALNNNITEYDYWPHDQRRPNLGYEKAAHTRLTHLVDIGSDVQTAVMHLFDGYPIYLGTSVSESMGRCDDVLHPRSRPSGGGHAVALVGYGVDDSIPGGGYFVVKNSWGEECGDKGYQYLPFSHCLSSDQYCMMWTVTGSRHKFKGMDEIQPPFEPFNPKKVFIKVESSKKWWERKTRHEISFSGDSVHLNQIKNVHFELEGTDLKKTFSEFDHNTVWQVKKNFKGRVNAWVETTWGSYDFGVLVP